MILNTIQPLRLWQRHSRLVAIAAILFGIAAAILLAIFGTDAPWVPKCPFHTLTGLDCPGCGSQRAIAAALHGHLHQAWHHNPALWIALPIAILYALIPAPQATGSKTTPRCQIRAAGTHPPVKHRIGQILYSPAAYIAILTAILSWTILRNLP